MKYILLIISLMVFRCSSPLPGQYENVEKLRTLAITFDNKGYAEAAPGDTVSVRGYFAGDTVRSIYWSVSNQLISSGLFGPDTFVDSMPLEPYMVPGTYKTYFGNRTDSVTFSFEIPNDVIRRNLNMNKPVISLFPESISDSLKKVMGSMTTGQLLDFIEIMSGKPELINPASLSLLLGAPVTMTQQELERNLSILLQIFSIKLRLYAIVNNTHLVRTFFTVRYNSRLKKGGINIDVNRCPSRVGVNLYEVSGHDNSFNPVNDIADVRSITPLGTSNDTVYLENGYNYYLVASRAENNADSSLDYTRGIMSRESFYYKWFFRNETEIPGVSSDELMKVPNITYDSSVVKMLPSLDRRMTNFSIWLCVYDDCIGTRLRPRGFTFKAISGVFRYSDNW